MAFNSGFKGLNNTLKIRAGILYFPAVHEHHDEVELQILK